MIVERVVETTPAAVGDVVAARLAAAAAAGPQVWALTGGSAARLVHPGLVRAGLDWGRVTLLFGDERAVAPEHADSNYRLARETLLGPARVPEARVRRMRGEADDLEAAARAYEAELPEFDVVLLGVGPDCHVCSLFPGHALLGEQVRRVAVVTDSPKPPPRRLTLTLPALLAAREVWFVLAGADKAAAARALGDPASQLPGALVARGAATARLFMDVAAAATTEAAR